MSTSLPPINDPSLIERLAKLSAHQPHTRHWAEGGSPAYTNALILEQSLHLLQHAHNPVAWRTWGTEAFEEAAERGLPLFVSVGYRACHWCQQMALESFDDLELAALLNERFVPIKVDRDERPEVDAALIDVAQVTTGKAGWPLSVVLSPERLPLFASTYLPLRDGDRGVEVGLLSYLKVLAEHWSDERLQSQAVPALEALQRYALQPPSEGLSPVWLELAAQAWVERFDPDWGGFSAAPKFPRPAALEALLRAWHQSGEQRAREAVEVTFERMACGGIYDHVGGGFARYSLDNRWWVPRFEKMLSDNAQLVSLALELLQATKRPLYAKVARDVLRFMVHELKGSRGAFASDISAYSMTPNGELKEGYFYTWTQVELAQALSPEESSWVCETFGVIDGEEERSPLDIEAPEARDEPSPFKAHIEGGRSVLHLYEPLTDEEERYWAPLRAKLYEVRSRRLKPLLNDAVLCSANALAMSAFARAAAALGEREWLRHAQDIADFIVAALWDHQNHKLYRLWRAGERGRAEGSLEDYMSLAVGLLDLFEVTGAARYLSFAREVYAAVEPLFDPERGGFFRSDERRRELLPFDEKPKVDGAEPSGNAFAALAALKLYQLTGEQHYRAQANSTLRVLAPLMESQPMSCPKGLSALAAWFEGQPSLTFVQLPAGSEPLAHPLSLALWGEFAPYSARLTTRLISAETKALAPALKAQPEECTAPRSARCGADGSALEVLSSPQALRASLRAHR